MYVSKEESETIFACAGTCVGIGVGSGVDDSEGVYVVVVCPVDFRTTSKIMVPISCPFHEADTVY